MNASERHRNPKSKIQNPKSLLVLALVIVWLGLACDHLPLGFDQLAGRDTLGVGAPKLAIPVHPSQGWCLGNYDANNASGRLDNLELGQSYAYESRVLVRFALADSAPTVDSVDSVKFVIHTHTNNPVPFSLFPVTTEWDEAQATWHDSKDGEPWTAPGGDFDVQKPLFSGTIEKDTTIFRLDTAVLSGLVHSYKGVIFIPLPSDQGDFASLGSLSASGRIPTITYFYGGKQRVFNATENTYLVDTIGLDLRPYSQFWLGSGYKFRTYLRFALDSLRDSLGAPLPIDTGATVVNAGLTLYPDSTFATAETIQVAARRLTRPFDPGDRAPTFDSAVGRRLFLVDTGSVINVDIRPIVQSWFQKPDSNFGLLLTVEPIGTSPVRVDLARIELRRGAYLPSLRINFVSPPHGRY